VSGAYYNEIDPDAVLILRALIEDGVIAPGEIDSRSISEVQPDDIIGFTQCHFFAGGGLWSVAARLAGWADDRPIWTASCPCQPFSVAGKGAGADDARHLWPDVLRLARARRPPVIVGEQVAGKAGYGWFDGVRADLAGEGYASRAVDIPACAVDAPHIRSRQYWVALADSEKLERGSGLREDPAKRYGPISTDRDGGRELLANANGGRRAGWAENTQRDAIGGSIAEWANDLEHPSSERRGEGWAEPELRSGRATATCADASSGGLGDAECARLEGQRGHGDDPTGWQIMDRPVAASDGRNGSFWSDHEWLVCHDGKARRTQPGVPLLVDGLPGRVGLWRVAGNAISPVLAAEVIGALMDDLTDSRPESQPKKQTANKASLSERMSENMSGDMPDAAEKRVF
jgi:DNA (cytosine-5)-methyltransferase 1